MEFKLTTTDAEDAAIMELTDSIAALTGGRPETVLEFLERHVRHQVGFAVNRQSERKTAETAAILTKVAPADKAAIDQILEKYRNPDTVKDAEK